MTSRQARRERREAERKAKRLALKAAKVNGSNTEPASTTGFVSQNASALSTCRADINRLNAQHSTGPKTPEGKLASSRNSLKHGLATGVLIVPGEDPAGFESLCDALMKEHQPAGRIEELLVHEMAQSWWLTQRAIRFQNQCFHPDGSIDDKRLSLFLRYQVTHERAFHKALNALIRLKKERRQSEIGFVSQKAVIVADPPGFVPQNAPAAAHPVGFVSQNPVPGAQNRGVCLASEAA